MAKYSFYFLLIIACLTSSCNQKKYQEVREWNYKQCSLYKELAVHSANAITVEIEPLRAGYYFKYPELFHFDSTKVPTALAMANKIYPANAGGSWIHTFCYGNNFFIGFKVKITNNTGQVLSLINSEMYYKSAKGDSVMALSNIGDASLVKVDDNEQDTLKNTYKFLPKSYLNHDGSIIDLATKYEAIYEKTRKRAELPYPVGIGAEVIRQNKEHYKMLGKIPVFIKNGELYDGILFFPALMEGQNFEIIFGNLIGKSNVKTNIKYSFKQDIGSVWLDKNKEQWIEGQAPSKCEYFDEKEDKWIMKN